MKAMIRVEGNNRTRATTAIAATAMKRMATTAETRAEGMELTTTPAVAMTAIPPAGAGMDPARIDPKAHGAPGQLGTWWRASGPRRPRGGCKPQSRRRHGPHKPQADAYSSLSWHGRLASHKHLAGFDRYGSGRWPGLTRPVVLTSDVATAPICPTNKGIPCSLR